MAASQAGYFTLQQFTDGGLPLVGGRLYTYAAGTTTFKTVYADAAGSVPQTYTADGLGGSYIALNTRAELAAPMYLTTGSYDITLKRADGSTVWTRQADPSADVGLPSAALQNNLASAAGAGTGGGMVAFSYAPNYVSGTLGGVLKTLGIDVTQAPYSADKTGTTDCSAAFAAVWAAFPGVPIRCPAGTYRMNTSVQLYTSNFPISVFGPGPKIFGDGVGMTIFDNRVANGPLFDIDSTTGDNHATFKGVLGAQLCGFTVRTTTSPALSTAIRIRTAYMVDLRNLHIIGMTGNGIQITCALGDMDASNMTSLEQIRIENCGGWGLKMDGDPTHNELSFVYMRHVFIQACGTANAAAVPPSGGMISKSQMVTMLQCAFTINQNCALYIPGQSGMAVNYDLIDTTFENNRARGLYCTGISVFKGRNLQFYNSSTNPATNACEFDGSAYTISQVDIDGVLVRATSGNNPHTAFKISGANANLDSCRVRHVTWSDYDYTGQTRFSGWQFDKIAQDCDLVALSSTSVLFRPAMGFGRGNKSPLRLRGGIGGTPSAAGEWIATEIAAAGMGIANTGLLASTRYYCYLYDNNGATALELSATGYATDTGTGYPVKSTDSTRLYVGSVLTDAGSLFVTAGAGWLNPVSVPGSQTGVYSLMWTDSAGRLRVKYASSPTSDVDGVIVGAQS